MLLWRCCIVGVVVGVAASRGHANDAATQPPPAVVYASPLAITHGGIYTGNFRSNETNTPAITVNTTDPVEITGCHILSSGIHIKAAGGSRLNIHDCTFTGQTPTQNQQWARVLDDFRPQSLTFEHNTVDHTGGLLVNHCDPNQARAAIRFNLFRNTDTRHADLSPGQHRAAILFNTVLPIAADISWNQFENLPGQSCVEDNINMYNSGGRAGAPIVISNNFIKGAYPYPLTSNHYTGSGITIEDDPSHHEFNNVSQYINVLDNQIVSVCNAGINVDAGHDIDVSGNTIVAAGVYPDGSSGGFYWAGTSLWNACHLRGDVFRNIAITHNTLGYHHQGGSIPFQDRQDVGAGVDLKQNISLPNPITLETEQHVSDRWKSKLAAAGQFVGNPKNR
jgi:hypothetical protein